MTDRDGGPFEEILDELGYDLDDPDEPVEQLLIYRESPDRQCFVCEKDIPEDSRELDGGEQYIILRENPEDEVFPLIERTFHVDCWEDYRSSRL